MNVDLLLALFVGFASLIVAFAIVFIVYETIKEARKEKKRKTPEPEVEAEAAPVAKEVVAIPSVEESKTGAEGNVVFNSASKKTHQEKYALLPSKIKKLYDDIVKYASSIEGNKAIKNSRYEEYKLGSSRLVRLLIKRGTLVAEFLFNNFDFKNYVSENRVAAKQGSTSIKVEDQETAKAVIGLIDIAHKSHMEERKLKKELAKEKRKAKNSK